MSPSRVSSSRTASVLCRYRSQNPPPRCYTRVYEHNLNHSLSKFTRILHPMIAIYTRYGLPRPGLPFVFGEIVMRRSSLAGRRGHYLAICRESWCACANARSAGGRVRLGDQAPSVPTARRSGGRPTATLRLPRDAAPWHAQGGHAIGKSRRRRSAIGAYRAQTGI